jgi:hypothetical protein
MIRKIANMIGYSNSGVVQSYVIQDLGICYFSAWEIVMVGNTPEKARQSEELSKIPLLKQLHDILTS